MSPSSVTNPSVWLNPATQTSLSAGSPLASGNFTSSLLQVLQNGAASAAGSVSTSTVNSTAGSAVAIGGHHHHGHHGGSNLSAQQLLAMLQQLNDGTSASASTAPADAASGATGVGAMSVDAADTSPILLKNLQTGLAASSGLGRHLNTTA